MVAQRRVFGVGLLAALALAGCASEPEFELPPPRYEEREAVLAEVREKLDLLDDADAAQATELLGHEDHRVRRAAAQRLGALGAAVPRPAPEDDVDGGEIADVDGGDAGAEFADAVEQLIKRLGDEHPRVQSAAALALASIGDERALDPLVVTLTDEDRFVRLWAWKALRRFGDDAIPVMISHTSSKSPYRDYGFRDEARKRHTIRAPLRERLASLGMAVVPRLIEVLSDDLEDGWVRINAAIILGMIGSDASESLPVMLENVDTTNNRLRLEIVRSLGHIGDLHPEVVPTLERLVRDRNRKISAAAKVAIKEIDKANKDKADKEKKKRDREEKRKSRPKPGAATADDKSGRPVQPTPGAAVDPSGIELGKKKPLSGQVQVPHKKNP